MNAHFNQLTIGAAWRIATAAVLLGACTPSADEPGAEPVEFGGKLDDVDGHGAADEPAPAVAYRVSSLSLRDPHFFVKPSFLLPCGDVTDDGYLGSPSVNDKVKRALSGDDPDDPDGELDLSIVLSFQPGDANNTFGDADLVRGACTAPLDVTTCRTHPDAQGGATLYSYELKQGLAPDPANLSGYSPAPGVTPAPALLIGPLTATLSLGDIELQLQDVMVAAQPDGVDRLINGTLRGFLPEAQADATILPKDVSAVGGKPLSVLLPGGRKNCAGQDDRDTFEGVRGWWIHADFEATRVDYSGDTP